MTIFGILYRAGPINGVQTEYLLVLDEPLSEHDQLRCGYEHVQNYELPDDTAGDISVKVMKFRGPQDTLLQRIHQLINSQ